MGSVFINYGVKAGGGPAFLRRSRTAFGQLQTRTRRCNGTPTNYKWSQGGHWGCNSSTGSRVACNSSCTPGTSTGPFGGPNGSGCYVYYRSLGGYGTCPYQQPWGFFYTSCSATSTSYSYGSFGSWSNTTSCSPTNPTCNSSGVTSRECRTVYSFRNEDWSAYEEVDVCTPTNPSASAGAVQVECIAQ